MENRSCERELWRCRIFDTTQSRRRNNSYGRSLSLLAKAGSVQDAEEESQDRMTSQLRKTDASRAVRVLRMDHDAVRLIDQTTPVPEQECG